MPPRYVGFWRRVSASSVDYLLFTVVLALTVVVARVGEYSARWQYVCPESDQGDLFTLAVSWLLPPLLTLLFWEYKLATPGKMIIGARIVDADTFDRPRPDQWIIRYLGYFVSGLPLGLGFLWIAFDPRKQGWHDKLAHTVVVFAADRQAAHMRPRGDAQVTDETSPSSNLPAGADQNAGCSA